MRFKREFIDELIDRFEVNEVEIEDAEITLDRHTDSPWEGGCADCYYSRPCLSAYYLARIIRDGQLQKEKAALKAGLPNVQILEV